MYKLLVYLKNFNDNESKGYDDKEDT
jgi:hypothetical protein